MTFRLSKRLFEHQVKKHKGLKVSGMIEQLAAVERYYSSDSECEYTINIEVIKTTKNREEFQAALEEVKALEALNPHRKSPDSDEDEANELENRDTDVEVTTRYECPYCKKSFSFEYSLKEHIKFYHVIESGVLDIDVSELDVFECPVCQMKLKNLRCLRKHLKITHNLVIRGLEFLDSIKIPIEEYPFLDTQANNRRGVTFAEGQQKCEYCDKICTNFKSLKQHMKLYHTKETGVIQLDLANMQHFFCPECDKNVKTRRNLRRHLRLCHNLIVEGSSYGEEQKQSAPGGPVLVRSNFSKEFPIYREKSPTSGKVRCTCGLCGYGPIIGHSGVIDHQVAQHGRPSMHNTDPKLFICDFCSKQFTHRDNIIKHLQIHTDRKYTCDLCDAKFKTLNCLKKHRAAHVTIKCGLCPREFSFRKEYKTHHRNEHSNRRKTYQMIEETSHEIIITNQEAAPDFQERCNDCNKVFYSKNGLVKHSCNQMAADGIAELICGIDDCDFITTDANDYFQHQSARHSIPVGMIMKGDSRMKVTETCHVCQKSFKSRKGFKEHKCKGVSSGLDSLAAIKHEIDIGYEIVENEIVGSEVIIS